MATYHCRLVTVLSITVPGAGFSNMPLPTSRKKRAVIRFLTMMTTISGFTASLKI